MRILAFESSAKAASVAVLQDGILLGEYYQNSGQTHSRTLMQMANNLLENCDLSVRDIDSVAVASGPGSFTGIRIGVSAAKGFAWGRELPVYGVSTLEAMAALHASFEGVVCASMDARRSQVYNALFRCHEGEIERITEDRAISLEELADELKNLQDKKILIGDGALLCYNTMKGQVSLLCLAQEAFRMQRASGVALLAAGRIARGDPGDSLSLAPNYLRLSQAEREKLSREGK